jgi:hypothetical protein
LTCILELLPNRNGQAVEGTLTPSAGARNAIHSYV